MKLHKTRWSKVYESAEEELLGILHAKHIDAERWAAEEGEYFAPHYHAQDKWVWCAEGSIVFTIEDTKISLQAGDVLSLPAGTRHEATAGISGAVCYEFPRTDDNPIIEIS